MSLARARREGPTRVGELLAYSDLVLFVLYAAMGTLLGALVLRRRGLPFGRMLGGGAMLFGVMSLVHLVQWLDPGSGPLRPAAWVSLVMVPAAAVALVALGWDVLHADRSSASLRREVAERTDQLEINRTELQAVNKRLVEVNEQLVEVNEELSKFTYVVSHDLRSPLRAIRSFTDILVERLDASLTPTDREYMQYVTLGVARMELLISDLLAYSRADHEIHDVQDVDLTALVRSIVDEVSAGAKGGEAAFEVGPLPTVQGEPTALRQVLQNLIDNAVKFAGSAPALVMISGERTPQGWAVTVADRGIGFDPKFAERIFEPFGRLHLPEDYEGTGIGLSIVRKLVRRHGGEIRVRASPGQGASFRFTLPRESPLRAGRRRAPPDSPPRRSG